MTQSETEPRLTPLHARHLALGATMAPFAGWDMPLWYKAGAVREHLAVVQAAGLFDTSHMDVLMVARGQSRDFLNFAFTRDISGQAPGRAAYGAFLDRNGHAIDDALVYPFADNRSAVVVNAGMGPVIRRHLADMPGAGAVTVGEPSPRPAKLDIQGPATTTILRRLLADAEAVLERFPYFTFKGDFDFSRSAVRLRDGTPVLLSRTGYTGEFGFELFLPADQAEKTWDDIMEAGADVGLLPCGLAARDSLRTGAVLALSHQDIGAWPFINHPWTFALPLAEDGSFTKPFAGSDALNPAISPHTHAFAGKDPRRVDAHAARVRLGADDIGQVLTIVTDMAIGRVDGKIVGIASPDRPAGWTPRGLACGFVKVNRRLAPGTEVVLADGRREITVEIVTDIRPNRTARRKIDLS